MWERCCGRNWRRRRNGPVVPRRETRKQSVRGTQRPWMDASPAMTIASARGLRPLPVRLRRLHRRLDESKTFDAVVDRREMGRLVRLLAILRRADSRRHFAIDIGEAFEIAFRMAGRNAGDARRGRAGIRPAARDDPRRLAERRPQHVIGLGLDPMQAAFRTIDAKAQAVLVAGRDLARPERAARAVLIAQ